MTTRSDNLVRTSLLTVGLIVVVALVAGVRTTGRTKSDDEKAPTEKWEYLAVAGPSSTNFTPTGNSSMRKEPNVPFGREGFVLEQHLDKLGANGWELITVAGPPTDPVYYFKRRK